jgi:hypothetical protein
MVCLGTTGSWGLGRTKGSIAHLGNDWVTPEVAAQLRL